MSSLAQAFWYGLLSGCAMVPMALGMWIVFATTRSFCFALPSAYLSVGVALLWTKGSPISVTLTAATIVTSVVGFVVGLLFQAYRRSGADEATQIISGAVILELAVILAGGLGLSEPVYLIDQPHGVWLRGLLGCAGVAVIAGILSWRKLGARLSLTIESPPLATELGVNVPRVEIVAFVAGAILCGISGVLDSLDSVVGAGPQSAFPGAMHATLSILLGSSLRNTTSFGSVAIAAIGIGLLDAVFSYWLVDGEKLLCPLLLILWMLLHPRGGSQ